MLGAESPHAHRLPARGQQRQGAEVQVPQDSQAHPVTAATRGVPGGLRAAPPSPTGLQPKAPQASPIISSVQNAPDLSKGGEGREPDQTSATCTPSPGRSRPPSPPRLPRLLGAGRSGGICCMQASPGTGSGYETLLCSPGTRQVDDTQRPARSQVPGPPRVTPGSLRLR